MEQAPEIIGRDAGGRWVRGVSGNPKGRATELNEVQKAAREHTKEAVDTLAFWMRSDNAKASVAACVYLLDRGWGKPAQQLEVGPDGGFGGPGTALNLEALSPDEFATFRALVLKAKTNTGESK